MTKIKICGLTRFRDIDYVNTLLPDYIGFVFAKASKRYISPDNAAVLKNRLVDKIKSVGVFVNEPAESIINIAKAGTIDIIQLHGNEDSDYIEKLRNQTDLPIIKAYKITSKEDAENAEKSSADYILLDNGNGGTGECFDWSLCKNIKRDFFLAGGLDPDNVKQAIDKCMPYAVDVSSGVETDGTKDFDKIMRFIKSVRDLK